MKTIRIKMKIEWSNYYSISVFHSFSFYIFLGITLLSKIQRVYKFSCSFRNCKNIIGLTVSLILTL